MMCFAFINLQKENGILIVILTCTDNVPYY